MAKAILTIIAVYLIVVAVDLKFDVLYALELPDQVVFLIRVAFAILLCSFIYMIAQSLDKN